MFDAQDREMPPLNDWLRGRHALTGVAPEWNLDALPAEPTILFREWILRADADGVPEPHTATLATVDTAGVPDARTLILKGIDAGGWAFASTRSSRKGEQLAASPAAAQAGVAPGDWVRWRVVPARIEFWQGSRDRRHTRVVYESVGDGWRHSIARD